jgi:hypothetical protein
MKKIFFVIWGNPKFYQTLIFLSQKISKQNFKVFILARNLNHEKDIIKKVYFGKNVNILNSPKFLSKSNNTLDYLIFIFYVFFQFLLIAPNNIIFFNKKSLFCILILKIFGKKTNFTYHNFDFDLAQNTKILKEKILIKFELFCSRFCNNLIFPSKERSNIFKRISKNKKAKFYSFMNCFPVNFKARKSSKFKSFFGENNLTNKKIVCYLGSIGPNHYLHETIKSFKFINDEIVLIIAGNSINNYAKYLKDKIKTYKITKKVFIIEDVSNDYWYEILKYSKLGVCFYKRINLSHKYMAGTSQKFNNYLLSNIPMIVNDGKDFKKFKIKNDIFEITKSNNPKKIASSIKNIFKNLKRYKKIKSNMKITFKKKLNFGKQFNDSYEKIL